MKINEPIEELTSKVMIHGFNVERFETFMGRVLTLAETLGLPERQEKAYKDLLKQECWSFWEKPAFIDEKDYMFSPNKLV